MCHVKSSYDKFSAPSSPSSGTTSAAPCIRHKWYNYSAPLNHASGTCGTPSALSSTSGTTSHVLCLSTSSVDYEFLYNCLGRYLNFTNHLFAHTVHVQEDLFPFDAASFVPNFTMNISSLQTRDKVFKFVHNTQ